MWGEWLLGFGVVMLLLAGVFWLRVWAGRRRAATGVPPGRVIFADDAVWQAQTTPLSSPALRLTGRPDYLVQQADGQIVPVEVKSRPAPARPFPSHVMQLAAYCVLVAETMGIRPNHGIIQYRDRAFSVPFTPQLEAQLRDTLAAMQRDLTQPDVQRPHMQPQRCAACGLRDQCTQRLA